MIAYEPVRVYGAEGTPPPAVEEMEKRANAPVRAVRKDRTRDTPMPLVRPAGRLAPRCTNRNRGVGRRPSRRRFPEQRPGQPGPLVSPLQRESWPAKPRAG